MDRRFTGLFVMLLLLAAPALAYKKIKRSGMGSARKDTDGFSFFSRAKKDNDAYYPRRFDDEDSSRHKPSRRNNLYAAKKMDEYAEKIGSSFATMLRSLFGYEEPSKVISGRRVKTASSLQAFNHELDRDWQSIGIVAGCSLLAILLIYCLLIRQLDRDDTAQLTKQARMRHHENYKNFEILKYIKENGVHPDRATGKIYDIRL